MTEQTRFEAKDYWEGRLGKAWGLESVGDRSLSLPFNEWMYRVRRHRFLQQIVDIGLNTGSIDVLDIGSGTGFYVDLWRELGVRSVTGSDLTAVAVRKLEVTKPGVSFRQLDIGDELPHSLTPRSFDVISAYDMFFHIVDDNRFDKAIANISTLLRPGGMLLFSDTLLTGERHVRQPAHFRLRRLDTVRNLMQSRGFAIIDQRPVFVLMNAPLDSSSRARQLGWLMIAAPARRSERVGNWLGRALFPLEIRLLSRAKLGPGVRMFACRLASGDESVGK